MSEIRRNIDIQSYLPHRKPMLMTTRMPYLDGTSVETYFEIEDACLFVQNGVLTEAGLIENAAQSCGAIVAQSYVTRDDKNEVLRNAVGYISAIKKIEINKLPKTGERIITKGTLISRYDTDQFSLCTMDSGTFRNGELIVACTFNFMIQAI